MVALKMWLFEFKRLQTTTLGEQTHQLIFILFLSAEVMSLLRKTEKYALMFYSVL